jgi:transposase
LGPEGPNAGSAIQLFLETAVGHRRGELLAFLLSLLFRFDQESADRSVPQALRSTIGKKLLIVWDRLQAHRSRLVKEYVEGLNGRIALEYLPAYAPELNPVEYILGYLKHHAMPNYCARDLTDLRHRASRNLRSMQRRGTLVTAFCKQAELF